MLSRGLLLNKFGGRRTGMREARGARAGGGGVRLARAPLSHGREAPSPHAAPRACPGHFLSRHKGRFKYFGMLFGDISLVDEGGAECSDVPCHSAVRRCLRRTLTLLATYCTLYGSLQRRSIVVFLSKVRYAGN